MQADLVNQPDTCTRRASRRGRLHSDYTSALQVSGWQVRRTRNWDAYTTANHIELEGIGRLPYVEGINPSADIPATLETKQV